MILEFWNFYYYDDDLVLKIDNALYFTIYLYYYDFRLIKENYFIWN